MKQGFRIALLLVVLYLNIKPFIDFVEQLEIDKVACCENTCHTEKNSKNTPNPFQSDKCFGKNCNPFQFCSTCSLMTKTVEIKPVPQPMVVNIEVSLLCNNAQNYVSTLYQPPQV